MDKRYLKSDVMENGVVMEREEGVNTNGDIALVKNNMDSDYLDDVMTQNTVAQNSGNTLYYFGNSEDIDGAMKIGATTVTLDGDTHNFYFSKSGGVESKGAGVTGIDSGKYIYKLGEKLKASTDDKYIVIEAVGDIADASATVEEIKSSDLRAGALSAGRNKDGDTVRGIGTLDRTAYLINTSGSIVKSKTAAPDGDDWFFFVDDKQIKMYVNNKNITGKDVNGSHSMTTLLTGWKTSDINLGTYAQ